MVRRGTLTPSGPQIRQLHLRIHTASRIIGVMSRIRADETAIICEWSLVDGRMVGNEACARIRELRDSHLLRLGADASGWDTLYIDPDDRRLWELIHPRSGMQGGGPPALFVISGDDARRKYGRWGG